MLDPWSCNSRVLALKSGKGKDDKGEDGCGALLNINESECRMESDVMNGIGWTWCHSEDTNVR